MSKDHQGANTLTKTTPTASNDCLKNSGFTYQDDVIKAIIGYKR